MTVSNLTNAEAWIDALRYPEDDPLILKASDHHKILAELKTAALSRYDEEEATLVWKAETIAEVQTKFITAFSQLKKQNFYSAWCHLEQCEITLNSLKKHHIISDDDPHRLAYIDNMIARWQSLYPYKVFFSPEILKKKIECSVCRAPVLPRSPCGHKKGKIYHGDLCHHIVTEMEFLSISAVENPVQRYSVAFLANPDGTQKDHYNYSNVKFVSDRVSSPFHGWHSEQTTRKIAASEVAHLPSDHPCPCLSGAEFSECCIGRSELVVPHLQIVFYVQPEGNFPENELLL